MIRRTDITPAEIIQLLQEADAPPIREGATDIERAEAHVALRTFAQTPDAVRAICAGCGINVPILEAAMCQCGGFVCAACQRIEEEGTCDHQPPDAVPIDEEADQ